MFKENTFMILNPNNIKLHNSDYKENICIQGWLTNEFLSF